MALLFHIPITKYHDYHFSTSSPIHVIFLFKIKKNSSHSEWVYSGILLYFWISIMSNNTTRYYSYAYWPFVYHLWGNISFSSLLISKLDCLFFSCWVVRVPYLFGYSILIRYKICKYFLPFCGFFLFLTVFFDTYKF